MELSTSTRNEQKVLHGVADVIFFIKSFKALKSSDAEQVIEHRNELVLKLQNLKNMAYPIYGASATETLFSAIVYYADEVVYDDLGLRKWHLLQEELLGCNHGGEHFFELCSQVVSNPSAPMILYKTFYMLLANNFRGVYFDDASQRNAFQQKLHFHIERNDVWINSTEGYVGEKVLEVANNKWANRLNRNHFVWVSSGLVGMAAVVYLSIFIALL